MFNCLKLKSLFFAVVCIGLFFWTQNANAADAAGAASGLRSGYLGHSVWNEGLSPKEINDQLKDHFAEVLVQLEAQKASSLLTALIRAEANSPERWTKSERRAALIYLAGKRQQQIGRIRDYMNRGRFPLNEGHSPVAVPVFVDHHGTHCAVGHLMRSDGMSTEVAKIVNADNLVLVSSVNGGGMLDWVRTSGLTQEEAAMIQPSYAVDGLSSYSSLSTPGSEVVNNGLTISDVSIRGARFSATLPASFQTNPGAIDALIDLGVAELDNNNAITPTGEFASTQGLVLGASDEVTFSPFNPPNTLDSWLSLGPRFQDGAIVGAANDSGNVGIFEVEYTIRAEAGHNFSNVGLFSTGSHFLGFPNRALNFNDAEQNAALILSEVYHGDSNTLLAQQQLLAVGSADSTDPFSAIQGSEISSLSADSLRIRSYGLTAGSAVINRIFNEFETTAVPEPSSGVALLLIGTLFVGRRKR